MDKDFDDIRPYRDHEVPEVMERLAKNEDLARGINFFLGTKSQNRLKPEEVDSFREFLRGITTVKEFQDKVVMNLMLEPVVKNSIDTLTGSGLEELSRYGNCIFISNHRDIVLDPALQNYLLMKHGFDTFEIAFGDNLLINEFISDLIRVNKSFIVKRSLPIKQQLDSAIHLSKYIEHTHSMGNSVWIAQREGRAKDGNDFSNPAVIKMLTLSQREKGTGFTEFINRMKIVPVAISYECDPCDKMKALELFRKMKTGDVQKSAADDMASMNQGISGYKGRVHVAFSSPLTGEYKNAKEVAKAIDRSIHSTYRLWPSNYIAHDLINNSEKYSEMYTAGEKEKFLGNYSRTPDEVRGFIMEAYANPVINKENLDLPES